MTKAVAIETLLACIAGDFGAHTDWDSLLVAANRTLVTGTIAERARGDGHWDRLPSDVQAFLAAIYERTTRRTARLDAQLAEALECLNRHDIVPILMKGAAIRHTPAAGGSPGRMLSDLDLMMPAHALPRAAECLRVIGYRDYVGGSLGGAPIVLFREDDVGMLDLHSRLTAPVPRVEARDIQRHCVPIRIGASEVLLPSPTAQALILIAHDQLQDRDYWRGLTDLRHLLDLDQLARTSEGIDWAALVAWFPPGYPRRALQTPLITAHGLLGTPVPPDLLRGWRPRLQYKRRLLQARRPYLRIPLTLLSLALDPPSLEIWGRERIQRRGGSARRRDMAAILGSGWRRFSRRANPGKL